MRRSRPNPRHARAHLWTAAVVLLALLASLGAWAQEPAAPTTEPVTAPSRNGNATPGVQRQNGHLVLNFRNASIDIVLDELSEAAGFIIVKEVQPQGTVTLTSRQPVSPEDAVSLLNTVLNNAGYSAIRQGRILKVVSRDMAKRLNIPVRSGNDPSLIEPTDELITQVIPLRHANAQELRQDLQPLINPNADFTSNASSNALVITDTSANVRRVVEIVSALDTSLAGSVDVKVFQLKYASAASAAALINSVFGDLQVGEQEDDQPFDPRQWFQRGRGRGRNNDEPQQQSRGARGSKINAAADERTNSVVVTGPGDTLMVVADVIRELDANPIADQTVYVYRLRNAQALNVEAVINSLFGNPTTAARGAANTTAQDRINPTQRSSRGAGGQTIGGGNRTVGGNGGLGQNGPGLVQQQQQQQQDGRGFGQGGWGGPFGGGLAGRNLSNNAAQTATDLSGQVTIIADPDTNSLLVRTSPTHYPRVKQVLDELDRPVAQVLIKVLIAEVTHDDSTDIGSQFSILNLRASGRGQQGGTNFNIPTEGSAATGLVVQVLETDFNAAIRALETEGKLDVLSRPYILASDNQLASITVGQEVPFITNSRITDTGQTINTIEYGDVGILLDVVPHINPDGLVILDVVPEISTLTGNSVPISELVSAPVIAKRSAQSRVGVRNGSTVVIGGLMEDRKTSTLNKVPLIGDIPILGHLFRRNQQTKAKTELLIFLTPHVASDPAMLEGMADEEVDWTELAPNAVAPGQFERHIEGLQRGATTQPTATPAPTPQE